MVMKGNTIMKKRVIALVTAVVMVFAMGCGKKNNPSETPAETIPVADRTVAQHLMYDFEAQVKANPDVTAQEVADKLLENEVIQFSGISMPVEEGLLNGFDNAEIKGFSEGVLFAPMIGTIPFVGYIFTLSDDADAAAFIQSLKDNANLRWNICTEADELLVDNVGNKVFFVMSPTSFDAE